VILKYVIGSTSLESLLGSNVILFSQKEKETLCIISNVEYGRRVAELQLSSADSYKPVLSILVSIVDSNHPELDTLDRCFLVNSSISTDSIELTGLLEKFKSSTQSYQQTIEIDGVEFSYLRKEIERLQLIG